MGLRDRFKDNVRPAETSEKDAHRARANGNGNGNRSVATERGPGPPGQPGQVETAPANSTGPPSGRLTHRE